jgi:hypothetical protein
MAVDKKPKKMEMSSNHDDPKIDPERCLQALTLAISRCRHRFICDNASLRLACKELKRVVDDLFLKSLYVSERYGSYGICGWRHRETADFEVLCLELLKNVQKIQINLEWDNRTVQIPIYEAGVKRILDITSPNLRELSIDDPPSLVALIKDNFTWPRLEKLTLRIGRIAEARHELYAIRNLRFLKLDLRESNKHDRKAFLRLRLANLTQLDLHLPRDSGNPLYMSKLFTRASQLQKLNLYGALDYNYFGGINLQNLRELHLNNYGATLLSPLLEHPRPTLRRLNITYAVLFYAELENFIRAGKVAFPNLEFLALSQLFSHPDLVLAWSCLSSIDLPNLTDLEIRSGFNEVIGIVAPTAKLPKLRNLRLGSDSVGTSGYPQDWERHAEQMFSSKLVQQLEVLQIESRYFRVPSLKILCKHAPQFKNLRELHVHSYNMEGVKEISKAGLDGGFPKLERIRFWDMDETFRSKRTLKNGRFYVYEVELLLKSAWPDIEYEIWYGIREEMQKYGQPDEFEEAADPTEDQLDEMIALQIDEEQ